MTPQEAAKQARTAYKILQQQTSGADDARLGRPKKVLNDMVRRADGKTFYETAYDNYVVGRDLRLAGRWLKDRDRKSKYRVLGYNETDYWLDRLRALPKAEVESVEEDDDLDDDIIELTPEAKKMGWTVSQDGKRIVPPNTSVGAPPVKPELKPLPRVETTPVARVLKPEVVVPAPWRIEFEPAWVEEEDGRDYRADRITAESVERIGAFFLAGELPSLLERVREHDMWPEALTAASTGSEQGDIEDALWTWAVSSAAKGWTFENGTFTRRAS